ncbi:MAG: helix-hairpin-helix domain-containing protein, partial [Candidatus Limivicinus sp.]
MDSGQEIEVLTCTVDSVIYSNEENGYAVLGVLGEDGTEQTITGIIPFAWPGEMLTAYGHWGMHATYGRQFAAETAIREVPEENRAIYAFLSSGAVKGIGPVVAGQIVEKFGKKTLQILEQEPERLSQIKGIGPTRARMIAEDYRRQISMKRLVLFLNECGVEPVYAVRVHRLFGEQALEKLKENPYLLTMDGVQAPFGAADRLAEGLGIAPSDPNRIRAGVRYILHHNERNGHCFIPYGKLLKAASETLRLDPEDLAAVLDEIAEEQSVIREAIAGEDACYLPEVYRAECSTAAHLARLAAQPAHSVPNVEELVDACEREQGIHYAGQQRQILIEAAKNSVLAVTGGPGTGKTTSLRGVLELYEHMGLKTLLAAPTGRAAKRMSELTGANAATIHRLLEAKLSATGMEVVFGKNRDDPLSCDAVIVDECSMVDIRLMAALLE